MPPPKKVDLLPPELRAALDKRIQAQGFAGYVELSQWLSDQGYEIGKSALNEHGQVLQEQLAAVRASTMAATLLEEAARDEADARSNAIYAQFQTGIFDALLTFQRASHEADPAERLALLTKTGRDFAAIGRANIARQKHAAEVRTKINATLDALGKSGEVPLDALARVQQAIQAAYGNL